MRVLALIPARGGSKGVPRKNVRVLGGRPLITHTIDAARASRALARVVVSTDDEEIREVSLAAGAEVPFLRPAELAGDAVPTLPVVQHALTTLGESFDAVCLLQPTSPYRRPGLIDDCIDRFAQGEADTLMTVLPVPPEHNPHWVYFADDDGALHLSTGEAQPVARRQELPPAFHREGSVYLIRTDVIRAGSLYGDRVVGFEVDAATSVNIDSLADWQRAEALLSAPLG